MQNSNQTFYKFSSDYNHEQQNSEIKCAGGTIGLTKNDSDSTRWLDCWPEVSVGGV